MSNNKPPTSSALCWACHNRFPLAILHQHHRNPRAAGGSDAGPNLVLICPGCHNLVHRTTELVMKGRVGVAKDVVGQVVQTDLDWRDRLWVLVGDEAVAWRSGKTTKQQVVSFNLPRDTYNQLKKLADVLPPNPRTKRKVGIGRLLRSIVCDWLSRQKF